MGNLDQAPMDEVTGSTGPAIVLRAVFAELKGYGEAKPLYLSPRLASVKICQISGLLKGTDCPAVNEWFEPGKIPTENCNIHERFRRNKSITNNSIPKHHGPLRLLQPTPGLQLALDPRIPDNLEVFPLVLSKNLKTVKVDWIIDGTIVESTFNNTNRFLWNLSRGTHTAHAKVWLANVSEPIKTNEVKFTVK